MFAILLICPLCHAKRKDKWITTERDYLLVYSNLLRSALAEELTALAEFRQCIETGFPEFTKDRESPTLMVIAKDLDTLDPFLPYVDNRLPNVSGLYLPDTNYRIILILHDDARGSHSNDRSILHEYVHEIMLDGGDYPAWAAEGIAEALSTFKKRSNKYWIGDDTLMRRKLLYRKRELRMPLWDMFSINVGSRRYHSPHHQRAFYNTSWLFAHYCLVSDGREFRQAYLDLIEIGKNRLISDMDIERLFGTSLFALNQELLRFANLDKTKRLEIDRKGNGRIPNWRFRPAEENELHAVRAITLKRVGRTEEAKSHLQALLNPTNPPAKSKALSPHLQAILEEASQGTLAGNEARELESDSAY